MEKSVLYFLVFLVTSISAICIFLIRVCYASKCTRFDIGINGIHIERQPSLEMNDIHADSIPGRTMGRSM